MFNRLYTIPLVPCRTYVYSLKLYGANVRRSIGIHRPNIHVKYLREAGASYNKLEFHASICRVRLLGSAFLHPRHEKPYVRKVLGYLGASLFIYLGS